MLLRFKADNYKNFADGFEFSMVPNPLQKDLPHSLLQTEAGDNTYNGLSSGIIFGPNAARKSNIINAIDTFKQIVLRGNIRNVEVPEQADPMNCGAGILELIPNRYLENVKPVAFEIEFVANGAHFRYAFAAEIGTFLNAQFTRQVLSELLDVNKEKVFAYEDGEYTFGAIENIPDDVWGDDMENRRERADMAAKMAKMATPTDLFLMNGFRTSLSPAIAERIRSWLSDKLVVLCNSQATLLLPRTRMRDEDGFIKDDYLSKIVSTISPDTDAAGYVFGKHRRTHLGVELSPDGMYLPAEVYESHGAFRFLSIFPGIMSALKEGRTLLMDEFDASLHPFLAQEIIALFHNNDVNTKAAQLITTTHNVVHMSSSLYRRDEIHLVDMDRDKHSSTHYTLADFGTQGEKGVRKNEAYMRQYLREAYGAYPDFDLDHLVEIFFDPQS